MVRALRADPLADHETGCIVGQPIEHVEARGKNLLIHFGGGRTLHLHLRMMGRIYITEEALAASRARLREHAGARSARPQLLLKVDSFVITGNRIPVLRLLRKGQDTKAPDLASLGPDLLSDSFDEDQAVARLVRLGPAAIGPALLMQQCVSGIGNVYKSEVLFLERVPPTQPVASLGPARLRALLRRARQLLQQNSLAARRTTRTTLGGSRLWVYRRAGLPCFCCNGNIAVMHQGPSPGRSTYYCATCQGGG